MAPDVRSRKIVGWSIANHLRNETALNANAVEMAVGQQRPRDVTQFPLAAATGAWPYGRPRIDLCAGIVPLRGHQDADRHERTGQDVQLAVIGGNILVAPETRAKEVSEFVVVPTKPSGRAALEPAHGLVLALDAAMILLNPVVEIAVGSMAHTFAEFGLDRPCNWLRVSMGGGGVAIVV
jgi:hypothetical protein